MKRFCKYLVHTKLHAMHLKWRFIYTVIQRHIKLKGVEITEHLFVCDSSESNIEEFL